MLRIVLVCPGPAITSFRLGGLNNTVVVWKSQIKVPVHVISGEGSPWLADGRLLWGRHRGRAGEPLVCLLRRILLDEDPTLRTPVTLMTSVEAPSPNTVMLQLGLQHLLFNRIFNASLHH